MKKDNESAMRYSDYTGGSKVKDFLIGTFVPLSIFNSYFKIEPKIQETFYQIEKKIIDFPQRGVAKPDLNFLVAMADLYSWAYVYGPSIEKYTGFDMAQFDENTVYSAVAIGVLRGLQYVNLKKYNDYLHDKQVRYFDVEDKKSD